MSRRFIIVLALTAIMLYFSLIMFMIGPLHSAGNVPWSRGDGKLTLEVEWCQKLRYRVPPAHNSVALVSFPGSGNTWLRYLLQQATGIVTGSIYMDFGLLFHGFPAENVTNGSVLVAKTHSYHPEPRWFKDAILLIRKPRDAILADFNRIHRGHLGTAPRIYFKMVTSNRTKSDWEVFVHNRLTWYEDLYKSYLQKFSGRLMLVFYEVLVRDTEKTLKAILKFLNYTVSQEDINCAMAYKEGIYRRWKKPTDYDPFTPDMYRKLDKTKNRVLAAVAAHRSQNNRTVVLD